MQEFFKTAVPVWEKGKEKEKNYSLLFRTVIEAGKDVKLTLECTGWRTILPD